MNLGPGALFELARIAPRLGIAAGSKVLLYRVCKRTGLFQLALPPVLGKAFASSGAELFDRERTSPPLSDGRIDLPFLKARATELLSGTFRLYFHHPITIPNPVTWTRDPLSGGKLEGSTKHWSHIPFFPSNGVDIKNVWELGRWYWLTDLSRHFRTSHDQDAWDRITGLINSWLTSNPPYRGPHWMCGQETAIRLINMLLASYVLNGWRSCSEAAQHFIFTHLKRIRLTLSYALAQENNHSISEAAGLFVGGSILASLGNSTYRQAGLSFRSLGHKLLERLVIKLFQPDGSFSQRSTNYHRLVLDSLGLCLWTQQRLNAPTFSDAFILRVRAAWDWLYDLVDPISGRAPNFGGSDGSLLYSLTGCDFTDFRPTLQFTARQLGYKPPFAPGPWDEVSAWLDIPVHVSGGRSLPDRTSRVRSKGGYVILRPNPRSWALFHVPQFTSRPAHADLLHLDLWRDGVNVLRDSGSFSYHSLRDQPLRLQGTLAHNTISFDRDDQMPQISRFLFGRWTNCTLTHPLEHSSGVWHTAATYTDYRGRRHTRSIYASDDKWIIEDLLEGDFLSACLSWHLAKEAWSLANNTASSRLASISLSSEDQSLQLSLSESYYSPYYQKLERLPCLRCLIQGARSVTTTILFAQ